jgi:hypothetical protein
VKKLTPLALLAGLLACGTASATIINGTSLQDELTRAGATVDVQNDQYNPDEIWQLGATGFGGARMLFEIAGNANSNAFGIYDVADRSNRLTIFQGPAGTNARGALALNGTSDFCAGGLWGMPTCATFGSHLFGFFLDTPEGIFYSELDANADHIDHMVAFQGGTDRGAINGSRWLANEFILAWEDLSGGGDLDYDDLVVLVESVISVAEPGTLALFAIAGLGMLVIVRRRRRFAKNVSRD